jgi:alkanesulfonate monooxygenase SsuD/methylene tetrahydromethanopterin reductase-like flavin-dependent oxidoreductase (luciferase family)
MVSDERATDPFSYLVDLAQTAEDSGFDSIWVEDRSDPGCGFEAYTLLGALAVRTRTARLGALVTSITSREPGVLAKQVTALDILSAGRACLGVGAGQTETAQEGFDRLDEALQEFGALLDQSADPPPRESYEGRYYQLEGAPNRPRPVQEGGVPVMIGADDDRTLELVAKYADACTLSGDLPTIRRRVAVLDRHLEAFDRDPSAVTRTLLIRVAGDPDRVTEKVAGYIEAGIDGIIVKLEASHHRSSAGELVAGLGRAFG